MEFIDLFAGIGGMRLGFEETGASCVFSSEIDKYAQDTYEDNFGERPHGDIRDIDAVEIPRHDFLLAGFPCQPFSIAGVSKLSSMKKKAVLEALGIVRDQLSTTELSEAASSLVLEVDALRPEELSSRFNEIMDEALTSLGIQKRERVEHLMEEVGKREDGFIDQTRGTLFYEISRILEFHKPSGFLLENVKGLKWHDKGRTFSKILDVLEGLGYKIDYQVVSSVGFVPQRRERIFIAGFRDELEFEFPEPPEATVTLDDILEDVVDEKYTLNDHLWNYHQERKRIQKEKGNGFGYRIFSRNDTSGTLSARYYKDGADILLEQEGMNPRMLTPRECARLMGFPDDFILNGSEVQTYKQLGNAVVPPVVEMIAREMIHCVNNEEAEIEV